MTRVAWTATVVALACLCVAACTLYVDSQWKDYSGNCQLSHANDNVCGQCVTKSCQSNVNQTCGSSDSDELDRCMADPSYGVSGWQCKTFVDDAAINEVGLDAGTFALRHCVATNCSAECSACTEVKTGPDSCGACMRANCVSVLDGQNRCCSDPDITIAMSPCADQNRRDCSGFTKYSWDATVCYTLDGGPPPTDPSACGYCMYTFSTCVHDKCGNDCH